MGDLVIQACGRGYFVLVLAFATPAYRTGPMMVKELGLKLNWELLRVEKLSLHLLMNHWEGVSSSNLGQIQSHPL